ncbi:TAXI family TRAP transporter solute-binding subunit [Chelativorans xinjiangense]|uniref:TAXI family TRAP transporter solute-binding subunit n=1 Tax=Chelativorans xinjiangense TaxID=2681485 RepID=UPI001357A506|nr:TAXI family TRAP transporter solute-binding subunit [Chelativorans xinjiangense]
MHRRLALAAALLAGTLSLPVAAQEKPDSITIFTSVSGSSWYGIGAGMAEIFGKKGVQSNPELGAALSNIANVAAGKGELGFTMSPAVTVARNGQAPFDAPIENVAVIARLDDSIMHIIIDGTEEISTVADLKGRPFVTQPPGSITAVVFDRVLSAYGLSEGDLRLSKGSLTEQTEAMKDRRSDGMVSIATYPSSWVAELASTVPIRLVPIPDDTFAKVAAEMPTVGRATIPAESYEGQGEDVPTLSASMLVVSAADIPEEEAYWIARALAENIDAVRALHASFAELTVEEMADVPGGGLHPGAERYYREVGALK